MIRIFVRGLLPAILILGAWTALGPMRSLEAVATATGPGDLEHAIRLDPSAPSPHYRLGILVRDFQQDPDPSAARVHLERAVELNPWHPRYRTELARIEEFEGRISAAEAGFLAAAALQPENVLSQWETANFLARQGRPAEAAPWVRGAAAHRDLTAPAAILMLRAGASTEILAASAPPRSRARVAFLQAALGASAEPEVHSWAFDEWRETARRGDVPLSEHGDLLARLLMTEHRGSVRPAWISLNRSLGRIDEDFEEGRNWIWNGDFEWPTINTPLGWQVAGRRPRAERVEGAGIDGGAAMTLTFSPRDRPAARSIRQQLLLPAGRYRLSFATRGEDGGRPVRLEIREVGTRRTIVRTPPSPGLAEWSHVSAAFVVADDTVVQVRSEEIASRDRPPKGRVHLDRIRLQPRPRPDTTPEP